MGDKMDVSAKIGMSLDDLAKKEKGRPSPKKLIVQQFGAINYAYIMCCHHEWIYDNQNFSCECSFFALIINSPLIPQETEKAVAVAVAVVVAVVVVAEVAAVVVAETTLIALVDLVATEPTLMNLA